MLTLCFLLALGGVLVFGLVVSMGFSSAGASELEGICQYSIERRTGRAHARSG